MPTLTASAPASISALAPSGVATLPAMTWTALRRPADRVERVQHALGMAVRGVDHHEIARRPRSAPRPAPARRGRPRSRRRPAAAPARPWRHAESVCDFSMSLTVIRPMQAVIVVDHQQFLDAVPVQEPLRLLARHVPSRTVDQILGGHQLGAPAARVGREAHVAVGQDPARGGVPRPRPRECRRCGAPPSGRARRRGLASGSMRDRVDDHAGLELLDLADLGGLLVDRRLRWRIPSPPCCAIAIARLASVTVSMAAEISGMPSSISRVSRVRTSTSAGRTAEYAGASRTSSNASASRISHARRSMTTSPLRDGADIAPWRARAKRDARRWATRVPPTRARRRSPCGSPPVRCHSAAPSRARPRSCPPEHTRSRPSPDSRAGPADRTGRGS